MFRILIRHIIPEQYQSPQNILWKEYGTTTIISKTSTSSTNLTVESVSTTKSIITNLSNSTIVFTPFETEDKTKLKEELKILISKYGTDNIKVINDLEVNLDFALDGTDDFWNDVITDDEDTSDEENPGIITD